MLTSLTYHVTFFPQREDDLGVGKKEINWTCDKCLASLKDLRQIKLRLVIAIDRKSSNIVIYFGC